MSRIAEAELNVLAVHQVGDWVRAIGWSPEGRKLAAASADGAINTLDLGGGQPPAEQWRHGSAATCVAWGEKLVSGGQDGQLIFDGSGVDAGGWVHGVTWRPDGAVLAAASGKRVGFWSQSGECIDVSRELDSTVTTIAWHPRGVKIAAGSYGGVEMIRAKGAATDGRLRWKGSVLELAFSPDGNYLAHGNQDASVHFWDLRKSRELEMAGYPLKVRELAWRDDSQMLATGGGPNIVVWDLAGKGPRGTTPCELLGHADPVSWIGFQPGGKLLASISNDGRLALWHPPSLDQLAVIEFDDRLDCAAWSPDGSQIAVGGSEGLIAAAGLSYRS